MNILDYTKFTAEEVAGNFWLKYLIIYYARSNRNLNRSDFYCGITNDLKRRAKEHGIDDFHMCAKCSSFKVSSKAEGLLAVKGFDCGAQQGNGDEYSVYIYMYEKIPGVTKE